MFRTRKNRFEITEAEILSLVTEAMVVVKIDCITAIQAIGCSWTNALYLRRVIYECK